MKNPRITLIQSILGGGRLMQLAALVMLLLASCSSADELAIPGAAGAPETAPLCQGTVAVMVRSDESRASNIDGSIDRYTATRCDGVGANYTIVSYHGRNQEQIGMVHVIDNRNGAIISELSTLDARVNFVQYRKGADGVETAYIGVDRKGADGVLCGILAVPMKNGKFVQDAQVVDYTPYKVEGLSINCIKYTGLNTQTGTGDQVLFVAAGGNEGLGENGKAGFTKFGIDADDPTRLTLLAQVADSNFRGYWFSYDHLSVCPIAYTYRTVEDGELQYKLGVIKNAEARGLLGYDSDFLSHPALNTMTKTVYTKPESTIDLGRFGVSTFYLGGSTYMVVSTGSKDGGIQVWRHDGANDDLVLTDTWHKAAVNTSSLLAAPDGKYYIFASCAGGVYKLEVQRDDETRAVRLVPVAKRVTTVETESGTMASTNYVQLRGTRVHVAGGYEGYYVLDWDDAQFVAADPRNDN